MDILCIESRERMEKNKFDIWKECKRVSMIVIAALIFALNIKTFVRAGGLIPGGLTGVTILIQNIGEAFFHIEIPFSFVNILLNVFPAVIAFKTIGKKFTIYSCLLIFLTSVFTDMIPAKPIVSDVLLICIFGGIINGFAATICLRSGASAGGMDFIAIFLAEKFHVDAWNYVLGVNAVILLIAGYLFGWNQALYSIIFQFAATQVLQLLHKHYQKHTLFIITDYPEEVYEVIWHCTNHGATMFKGMGCYDNKSRSMVYSVVSSDEVKKVKEGIRLVDPSAFVNIIKTDQLDGRFYQRPNE